MTLVYQFWSGQHFYFAIVLLYVLGRRPLFYNKVIVLVLIVLVLELIGGQMD